ncbi:auxin efflux carrier [Phakopsora pachyrhizi]|uniref:Auxin efflux carrier n=1 Tax=Phakopsora pachyrhizi TaxID=170000 RepID=A0AAV0AID0_PHAPC|nr:auxin efflux carrier [Phakopsora pachyrhizi]
MSINSGEFCSITLVVVLCILQLAALCIAGWVAAWREILTPQAQKSMVRINVCLFTPALIFGKTAFELTPKILASLWIAPVGFTVLSIVSALIAWVIGLSFRLKNGTLNVAVVASMIMNANTLPIAFMNTFSNSLHVLNKSGKDTPEHILSKAIIILALYATVGNVIRWSLGIYILEHAVVEAEPPQPELAREIPSSLVNVLNIDRQKTFGSQAQHMIPPCTGDISARPITVNEGEQVIENEYGGTTAPPTALMTPLPFSTQQMLQAQEQPLNGVLSEKKTAKKKKVSWRSLMRGLIEFFNPPLLSSILAIVVSCIPAVQKGLGSVKAIRGFLTMAGDVAIPLTLVNIGGLFYHSRSKVKTKKSRINECCGALQNSYDEKKATAIAIFSRQVLSPAIMLPLLSTICHKTNLEVVKDPVFLISSTLVICSPPAVTLAQMIPKSRADKVESLISDILFWAHILVTPITTVIAVIVAVLIL